LQPGLKTEPANGACRCRQGRFLSDHRISVGLRRSGRAGNGFQPAIVRAHFRANELSVIAGNRRRTSSAAAKSPHASIAARIAAASASDTVNISRAWPYTVAMGKRPMKQRMEPSVRTAAAVLIVLDATFKRARTLLVRSVVRAACCAAI
jgi:hypothetical protein